MGSGILGIGVSGLNAAQAGMLVTGQNITNANTPGYNRQQAIQSANNPLATGSGFFGQGVQISTVQRLYNDFLTTQVNQAQTQSSQLSTYSTQINQIESLLGSSKTGFEPAIQAFFSSVQGVSNNPSSVPSRQAMLSASQSLVASFQTISQQLNAMQTSVNGQITSSVASINSYAQQIAQLNQSIVTSRNSTGGQPPNDLMDQRDQLVSQLNKEIQTTVLKQSDGSYSVFVGSGQGLVVGNQSMSLAAVASSADPNKTVVAFSSNGVNSVLPDSSIVGGNLGGLYAYRSQSLDAAQNAMGRIAVGLAQTFNQQSQLGQDLNGNPGSAYFSVAAPVVIANTSNGTGAAANVTLSNARATSNAAFTANLSSAAASPANPFSPGDATSFNAMTNYTAYDSLGQTHSAATYFAKTATPNQWLAYTYVDGATADAAQTAASLVSSVISAAASTIGGISAADTAAMQNAATAAASAPGATAASISAAITAMTSPPLAAGTVALLPNIAAIASQSFTAGSAPGATVATLSAAISGATGTTLTAAQLTSIATLATSSGATPIGSANPSVVTFTAAGAYASATNAAKSVTLSNGAAPLSLNLNFSGLTQSASATTSATVSANGNANTSASQLTGNDYTLRYDGTASTWSLLNNSTNQTVSMTGSGTAASPFIADGMSFVVTPPAAAGQSASFLIRPTVNGAQNIGVSITDTSLVAAASRLKTSQALNPDGTSANVGTAVISAATINSQNASLQDAVSITFNNPATTYTVKDTKTGMILTPPGGVSYTSGNPISFNGWTVSISGTPSSGDSFTVGPNAGGATDNSNALLLAGLQTQNTLVGNTASFEGAYSQLVSKVGNTVRQMQVMSTSQTSMLNQLTQSQQSVSGVNLDEEAANLIRFQQAYQAAGKMMQISNTLFNSILQI